MNSEETFQMPPELQDVPVNYSMNHITYEDVNGILSLVEIALARGSIKGDELTILNQIRNDCMLEVQDYQAWVQKRQQVLAIEEQLAKQQLQEKTEQEIINAKATADAKIQSAQEAAKILQNRVVELENQIKARNISPVDSAENEETIREAMKPQTSHLTADKIDGVSKAFEGARALNPVPTVSNQPIIAPQSETTSTIPTDGSDLHGGYTTAPISAPDVSADSINEQMESLWERLEEGEEQEDWDEQRMDRIGQNGNDGEHYDHVTDDDYVEPLFSINIGQDGNVPLGDMPTEEDKNANVTEMDLDEFEHIDGDGEVEIEVSEDPESVAEVQAMKDAIKDEEDDYEEIVIPNSMELKKMTKGKIAEIGTALGFTISESQTKDSMIKDFEEESWNLIEAAKADEGMTVTTDEDIIRDGGYFGEDDSS